MRIVWLDKDRKDIPYYGAAYWANFCAILRTRSFRIIKSQRKCRHENAITHKWNNSDGTPMVHTRCECGYRDHGHVYGDSWAKDEITF